MNIKQTLLLSFLFLIFNVKAQKTSTTWYQTHEEVEGKVYKYVSFDKIPKKDQIQSLSTKGITLIDYVGDATYLASLDTKLSAQDIKDEAILDLRAYGISDKADITLRNNAFPNYSDKGSHWAMLIRIPNDQNHELIVSKLKSEGVKVIKDNGYNDVLEVLVRKDQFIELLSLPYILTVEPINAPDIPDDRDGQALHKVNRINGYGPEARNYTGAGINILVRDDGALFEHLDLHGRINQEFVGESRGDHGDGVAGIMTGAGNLDPQNQGMAYGSFAYVLDYEASFLDQTMSLFRDYDVLITNSSYSNGCNNGYTNTTRNVDQQIFENPSLLHVFSAGNNGESDCAYGAGPAWGNITGGHKMGKNVIAVANLNSIGVVESSSSRGPASDGRIKPDLAANGINHVSLVESNDYAPFGGTSAASPVVAGISSMLYEAYKRLYNEIPPSALIKATMLNTADDLGNKGPDFIFGWGNVNAHRAALALEENRFIKGKIEEEQNLTYDFEIPEGVGQLRIMTYWPDKEGTTNSGKHLINDLDIVVQKDSTTYLPWVLNHFPHKDSLNKPATKGEDHLNNVEQVAIDNPESGTYQLKISANNIPFGTADFYVVWEYRMKEIEPMYPAGGEHIPSRGRQDIHWQAEGDEGEFLIELVAEDSSVINAVTVPGVRRTTSISFPSGYYAGATIRISRDSIVGSSEPFLIAEAINTLNLDEDENGQRTLRWATIPRAVGYDISLLGEKYMEVHTRVDTNVFVIPNDAKYKLGWIAVTPIFEGPVVGNRSRAIPIRTAPKASIKDNLDGRPCLEQVITFSTDALDTLTKYEWYFGDYAVPQNAYTAGPHNVIYTRRGRRFGYLKVEHEGGTDSEFFEVNVQRLPEGGSLNHTNNEWNIYNFTTDLKFVDSVLWDFGDGNTAVGQNVSHTYATEGSYPVTMTGVSSCGNIVKTTSLFVSMTSTEDENLANISLGPNPNNGSFTIQFGDLLGAATIEINTIDGKQVQFHKVSKDIHTVEGLSVGQYLVQITTSTGTTLRKINVIR